MERCTVLVVMLVLGVTTGEPQNSADGLQTMLNQLMHNNGPEVKALSYCRISTQDLIATAQSTANRVLQGVCNPRELNERFTTLEMQVVDQFNVLKTMVLNLEDQLRNQDKQIKKNHINLRQALNGVRGGHTTAGSAGVDFIDDDYTPEGEADEDYTGGGYTEDEEVESPRDREISLYNSTMHQEDNWRVFTYYWRVRDINYKMKNWGWRRSLRSESFYIFQNGYRMYMRVYPNQRGENVYVHVGLTVGDYDANLDWPFKLKHRIHILDHGSPAEDIPSRVWDPTQLCSGWHWRRPESGDNYECVGLGFEQVLLRTRNYIHEDSMVIRLTVFLAQ